MSQSIIKAALKALPPKATAELKEFLECFATSMPREDLEMMDPSMLALAAEKHLALSKKRKPGETQIEIFIPEKPSGGAAHPNTVIEIINDDMAFLVDSIAAEITHNYKLIHLLVHPLISVSVGKNGKFSHIDKEHKPTSYRQSHIHIELQGTLAVQAADELEERLRKIIGDVRVATRDWQTMRQKLRDCEDKLKTRQQASTAPIRLKNICHSWTICIAITSRCWATVNISFLKRTAKLKAISLKTPALVCCMIR